MTVCPLVLLVKDTTIVCEKYLPN